MQQLDEIEKSVLIVNDIKTMLLREYDTDLDAPTQYLMGIKEGYKRGMRDCMQAIKDILNKY